MQETNRRDQHQQRPRALQSRPKNFLSPFFRTIQLTPSPNRFPRTKLPPRRLQPLPPRARRQKRPWLLGRRQRHSRQVSHVEKRPEEIQESARRNSEEREEGEEGLVKDGGWRVLMGMNEIQTIGEESRLTMFAMMMAFGGGEVG
jgi:hypothetical protein